MSEHEASAAYPWHFHVLHALERLNARCSLQAPAAVYDSALFAWAASLEANWMQVRADLRHVQAQREPVPSFQDISPEAAALTTDDRWKTYMLYAYGARADRNCRQCPATAALCQAIPGMKTAFFSILAPRKHIPPHRGPYNGLLRAHLGLVVPERGDCRMRVGDQIVRWREGEVLVFDDSVEHEVWNDSDEERVVLFLDVARPMRAPVSWLNEALIRFVAASPYGRRIVRRFNTWYERHGIDAGAR